MRKGVLAAGQTLPPSLLPGSWTPVCGRACVSTIVITLRTESVSVAPGARWSQREMLPSRDPEAKTDPSRQASAFSVDLCADS